MKTRFGFIVIAVSLLLGLTVIASGFVPSPTPLFSVANILVTESASAISAPSEVTHALDSISAVAAVALAPDPTHVLDSIGAAAAVTLAPDPIHGMGDWQEEARALKRDRPTLLVPIVPRQPFAKSDLFIYRPSSYLFGKPLRVLVALHGMGNRGDVFSRALVDDAERNGWLLLAPTMRYGDWMNPEQLLKDDLLYTRMLYDTLDTLPAELGIKTRQHVLLLGFSRGAQLAQRFAFFYPERVSTVATISGGAYTLPQESRNEPNGTRVLTLPFGVGDVQKHLGKPLNWSEFKKITFWVAVGANDNRKDDVPRNYDPYVGDNRLARAQNLYNSLCSVGVDAHIAVFPNTGHEMTTEIRRAAIQFLRDDEIADHLDD